MDQDTRWLNKYEEVVSFIETNHRNPSKYVAEDRDMLNWLKAEGESESLECGEDEGREGGEV